MALNLTWNVTSPRSWGGYDDTAKLRAREPGDAGNLNVAAILEINEDTEILLTIAELRELSQAAIALADKQEAARL